MPPVRVERDGLVAIVTLVRPERRNALDVATCDALCDALDGVAASDARAVVLRGEGRVFCAGADLSSVSDAGAAAMVDALERALRAVEAHRLPVVAAIHGAALGGGLQLATACDLRVTEAGASLGIPSARLGVVVNFENVERLAVVAGRAVAAEVLLTARTYTGEEALAAGLVHRCVADGGAAEAALELARHVASLAPLAVGGVKRALGLAGARVGAGRARDPDAAAQIDALVQRAYGSADLAEGVRAARERRPPRFEGR